MRHGKAISTGKDKIKRHRNALTNSLTRPYAYPLKGLESQKHCEKIYPAFGHVELMINIDWFMQLTIDT